MYGSHYILLHVDGDVNSQFKLGQELLARSSSSGDGSDVERGVSWLCKASRQGSQEATDELRKALENQLGSE